MHYLHFYWDFSVKMGEAHSLLGLCDIYQCSCIYVNSNYPLRSLLLVKKLWCIIAKNKLSIFSFELWKFLFGQDLYPPTILSFCLLANVFVFFCVCVFLKDSFAISDSWLTGFFPFGLCYPTAFCPPLLLMRSKLLIFIEFLTNGKSFSLATSRFSPCICLSAFFFFFPNCHLYLWISLWNLWSFLNV